MRARERGAWAAVTALVLAAAVAVVVVTNQQAGSGPGAGTPTPGGSVVAAGGDPSFPTLPVGAPLPSAADCAKRVAAAGLSREARPQNDAANHSTPPPGRALPPWPDFWAPPVNRDIVPRVDGQYTGSTNEIITWGACKWGIDANIARAVAVTETNWVQSYTGDPEDDQTLCPGDLTAPCPTSFGLMQLKHTTRPGSWPDSQLHTAFNVDYSLAVLRGCYDGYVTYLANGYAPGDLWGCVGWHYSGDWMDRQAQRYIKGAQRNYAERAWLVW